MQAIAVIYELPTALSYGFNLRSLLGRAPLEPLLSSSNPTLKTTFREKDRALLTGKATGPASEVDKGKIQQASIPAKKNWPEEPRR